jgi:long-chain acyl-CoA synthetase
MTIDKTIDMSQNKDILKLIRAELDTYNKLFAAHEQVKKFQLVTNEWTIDGGELTATMKLKRKVIMNKYADLIARIYN